MSIISWTYNLKESPFRSLLLKVLSKTDRSNHFQNILNLIKDNVSFTLSEKNEVYLTEENLKIADAQEGFVLNHYDRIKNLRLKGFSFELKDSNLFITRDKLTLKASTSEDLYIINELFVDRIYSFSDIDTSNTIVIDIGSNKGYAALYFIEELKFKKVCGFELVPTTFKISEENIGNNKHLSQQIYIQNVGLGKENKHTAVRIDLQNLGQSSLYKQHASSDLVDEECQVVSAKDAIQRVLEENMNDLIFLKIDCEGAETDIIEDIESLLEIRRITHIVIEWHFDNYSSMENILLEKGFTVEKHHLEEGAGLLKAIRK